MTLFDQLAAARDYADQVGSCAATIPNLPPHLAGLRDDLVTRARGVVADVDSPWQVGFMGEVSAGKSLLLGVLAGKPDLLPSSSNPTTGNVTEIRLRQHADPAAATCVDSAQVRYLTAQDLAELQHDLVGELTQLAAFGAVPADMARSLPQAIAGGTGRLHQWCRQAWRSRHPRLRKLIRTFVVTVEAAQAQAHRLGGVETITPSVLRACLELAYPMLSDDFPSAAQLRPTDLGLRGLSTAEVQALDRLAMAFPLIDRVVVEVSVSSRYWDLGQMRAGGEFVLLDFPGIGGGLSRARDLYLTRRGLRDAHCVVVLVDAERPGGAAADEFYGFLRELGRTDDELSELVVYCAGRFDLLTPPALPPQPDPRLTVDDFLRLPGNTPMRALLQSGHRPGSQAMSAFVSSVLAMQRLGLPPLPGGSAHGETAAGAAQAWAAIATALTADTSGRDLFTGLQEYARNGGTERVKSLISQHLAQHGLRHRLIVLRPKIDNLEGLKRQLAEGLREADLTPEPDTDDPAGQLDRLRSALNRYQEQFLDLLGELRDPVSVRVNASRSLHDAVTDRAAELVVGWPQWAQILGWIGSDNPGPAPSAEPQRSSILDSILRERGISVASTEVAPPTTMDALVPVFVDTCQKLREESTQWAEAGLRRWAQERARAGAGLSDSFTRILDDKVRARLEERGLSLVSVAIDLLLNPGLMTDKVIVSLHEDRPADPLYADLFPLRSEQAVSWAATDPSGDWSRPLVRALRLRSVLVQAVTRVALEEMDRLLGEAFQKLNTIYRSPELRLPAYQQVDQFTRAVLGEGVSRPAAQADAADTLDDLRPPGDGTLGGTS